MWLELDSKLTGDELEQRLGELSYQVNQLAHSGQTWGLKLAGRTIAPSQANLSVRNASKPWRSIQVRLKVPADESRSLESRAQGDLGGDHHPPHLALAADHQSGSAGAACRQNHPGNLGICAICFVWRLGIYLGKVARPPRVLVTVLAIAAALTLALVSRELGLLNALVNLLILGYSLKYIEMRSRRDVKAVVLVGYFLIALTFIDHQQMLDALQLSLVAALNTCVLASLYHEQASFNRQIKLTLVLLAQSLPLALLLFVVLPRFSPLWMVPQMKSSTTGLSDELSFGDISRLTKSNELAFRASFKGQIPAPEDRYWRALVLEEYDGKRWQQSRGIKALQQDSFIMNRRPEPGAPKGPFIDYSIIAEPSGQHWLFGLDLAYSMDPRLVNLPDFRLYAIRPVEQRLQYRVMSYPDAPLDNRLRAPLRQLNLSLPDEINPRSRKLAADFARRYPQAEQRLTAMMQYFNNQPFFYTLTPPPVGPQQLDDFLFENRAGFCVHYASAFTFMARATGLPARIVTGYQAANTTRRPVISACINIWPTPGVKSISKQRLGTLRPHRHDSARTN